MSDESRQYINPRQWLTGAWVPNWLLRRHELSPGAKLTYVRLVQYWHQETGYAWPRQQVLAQELGVSERHVRRWIAELVEAGLLEVEQVGLTRPNRYRFLDHPWMHTYVRENETGSSAPDRTGSSAPDRTGSSAPDRTAMSFEQSFDSGLKSSQDADLELDSEFSFGPKNTIEENQAIYLREKKKKKGGLPPLPPPTSLPPLAALWNEMVPHPKVLRVSGTRARHVAARMKTYPDLGWWASVIQRLLATPFLRGQNERGWVADFDWLVRNDENPIRVLEGKYDRAAPVTMRARAAQIEANLARMGGEKHD